MKWVASSLSACLGLLLAQLIALAVTVPLIVLLLLVTTLTNGNSYPATLIVGALFATVCMWFCFRFWLPAVVDIAAGGWKGLLAVAYLTPGAVLAIIDKRVSL